MPLNAITADDIRAAAYMPDLDEAVGALQYIAGIADGDVAGVALANLTYADWRDAGIATRESWLRDWLRIEAAYA